MSHSSDPKWTERFLNRAIVIAAWSKDPSTQVGAVAVDDKRLHSVAEGYNGLPRNVRDLPERMERPAKYMWTLHAEANLVAHAAYYGVSLADTTVYTTHYPCAQCAALLINAGVTKVVVDSAEPMSAKTAMHDDHFKVARQMFNEAGILVEEFGVSHATST